MGRVRVFYGHEGVVPPTGFRPRSAAAPAADDDVIETTPGAEGAEPVELVDEAEALPDELDADEAEAADADLPDDSWTKGDLIAFAEDRGFDMTGATKTKPAALARVLEYLKEK